MTPIVSIIIPAYNYANFLGECLDSVLAQTLQEWECIIVDNCSTDNTADIVKKYVLNDNRIKYHYTEQKGVSSARNLGVSLSLGKYILPLDADDKIAASYIQKAVAIMENKPNIRLVYCDAILFGSVNRKWKLPEYNFRNLLFENSIFCTALFKKTDFQNAKGYNTNMIDGFEDWDFWIKFLANDCMVFKINEPLFYYRIKENSRNSILDNGKQLRLRKQIYNNHQALFEQYFSIPELLYDNYLYKEKYDAISNSMTYKIGKYLMLPVNLFKKIVGKR